MAPTVKVVKMTIPINGETSSVSGSYSKAVSDAVGSSTVVSISTCIQGGFIIATIVLS